MTAQEYAEYQARFAAFMDWEGLANLTTRANNDETGCVEPFFSWRPCDCCQTHLGGNRYECDGYNPTTKEVQEYNTICTDCVYYAEYGRLDDSTMWDIEHSIQEGPAS